MSFSFLEIYSFSFFFVPQISFLYLFAETISWGPEFRSFFCSGNYFWYELEFFIISSQNSYKLLGFVFFFLWNGCADLRVGMLLLIHSHHENKNTRVLKKYTRFYQHFFFYSPLKITIFYLIPGHFEVFFSVWLTDVLILAVFIELSTSR